jgi:hypothetical protein
MWFYTNSWHTTRTCKSHNTWRFNVDKTIVQLKLNATQSTFFHTHGVDLIYILTHKWYAQPHRGTFYARAHHIKGFSQFMTKGIRLHKLLTNFTTTDHCDGAGLNNLNENLREGSGIVNANNRRMSKHNKSGKNGVVHEPNKKRYRACWRTVGTTKITRCNFYYGKRSHRTAIQAYEAACLARIQRDATVGCSNGERPKKLS